MAAGLPRHVRQRLCAVDDQVATVLVHELAEVLDRVLDAQYVGDLTHGQNLGLGAHLGKNFLGGELTGLGGVEVDAMPPMLTGGEMIDSVTEQDAVWAPVPEKFEAGTQDAAGIFATGAALDYLVNTVGYENIQAREQALVHYLMGELMQLDFVQIIGSIYWDNHHGVVSFNVKGIHPHDVASIMDMDGVCIRAGHHCAQPLLTHLGYSSTVRASLAFYNDFGDIDRLAASLSTLRERMGYGK